VRGEPVKAIAVRIGKSYQSVYREIARNRKPDGRYQPWMPTGGPTCGAAAQDAVVRGRCRAGGRRGRKAGTTVVTRTDQPVAASPLPA